MTANDIIGDARVARVRELKAALAEATAKLKQAEAEREVLSAHGHLALVALHDFERLGQEGWLHIVDGWNAILRCRNVSKLSSEDVAKLKADYLAGLGIMRPHSAAETCGLHSLPLTPPAGEGLPDAGHTPPAGEGLSGVGLTPPAGEGTLPGAGLTPPAGEGTLPGAGHTSPAGEGLHSAGLTPPAGEGTLPVTSVCGRSERQRMESAKSRPALTWIVFDGPEENSYRSGPYRVTYTGGTGAHRADRLILDYVHAAKLLGLAVSRICVETSDKALAKKVSAFGAGVVEALGPQSGLPPKGR